MNDAAPSELDDFLEDAIGDLQPGFQGFGNLPVATYHLTMAIHQAGYARVLGVVAFSLPPTPSLVRLDADTAQHLRHDIALTVQRSLRNKDRLFVLRDWEWVVILPNLIGEAAAELAADKIRRVISETAENHGVSQLPPAVCGIAFLHSGGAEAAYLIQSAQIAMHAAAERGQPYEIYAETMEWRNTRDRQIDVALRHALEVNDGISLMLLPQFDLADGHCIGLEGSVRLWRPDGKPTGMHPIRESLSRLGLRDVYNRWLFNQVGQAVNTLSKAGHPLPIALSLTPADCHDREFPDFIEQMVALHGIPAGRLCLQIPDNVVAAGGRNIARLLQHLVGLGIPVALTGLGAGLAGLGQWQDAAVRQIKIDPMVVRHLLSADGLAPVIQSLAEAAQKLGIGVLAEGIESRESAARLLTLGCHLGQGEALEPARSLAQLITWLDEPTP